MRLFKKPDYFDIGNHGTADQFLKANKKCKWHENIQRAALYDGAAQALIEGRPENTHAIFSFWAGNNYIMSSDILLKILEKSNDNIADAKRAVEKLPQDKREEMFRRATETVLVKRTGEEPFFLPLLFQSGAEANANTLMMAALYSSPAAVKLVNEAGVSFEEAIPALEAEHPWNKEVITRLKFYQQAMAEPAEEELSPKALEIIGELRQQIDDLTKAQKPQDQPSRPLRKLTRLNLK